MVYHAPSIGSYGARTHYHDSPPALTFSALSLYDDDSMDDDDIMGDDDVALAKDLQELFPLVEKDALVSTPRIYVDAPVAQWPVHASEIVTPPAPRRLAPVQKPKRYRQRDRKRSDQQKQAENAKRRVQQIQFQARRKNCLAKERGVRLHVRRWISEYAEAIGIAVVDDSIVPLLPVQLRAIMARSDAAIASYCGFSGQVKRREAIIAIPAWY